jgi:hypothetical protein
MLDNRLRAYFPVDHSLYLNQPFGVWLRLRRFFKPDRRRQAFSTDEARTLRQTNELRFFL